MPALQREAARAEERLLGDLRQSVPQNGRVHLHIIEMKVWLQDAKTVTAMVIKLTHPNFKTVTTIWGNKFSRVTRLPE